MCLIFALYYFWKKKNKKTKKKQQQQILFTFSHHETKKRKYDMAQIRHNRFLNNTTVDNLFTFVGLSYIEELASQGSTELRLDLTAADGSHWFETYSNFKLTPTTEYYLNLSKGHKSSGE